MDASEITPAPAPAAPLPPRRNETGRLGAFSNLAHDEGQRGVDLIKLTSVLWRRRAVVIACTMVLTTIATAIALQLTPRYTAESSVILDGRKTQVVDLQAVLSGLPVDAAVIRSEIEILQSSPIAEHVAKKLNLAAVPEFNPKLRRPSALAPLFDAGHWAVAAIKSGLGAHTPNIAPADPAQAELLAAAAILRQHVDILNDGRSYVLKIRAESEDPKLAAGIANAYTDTYLEDQLEAKFEAVRRANAWLNDHLAELRAQVEATDRAVQTFKAQHDLTQTKGETVTAQQVAELNSQLILAGADRAEKESNLSQIQEQLRAGGVAAAAQVLASPLIQKLREQESDLVTQEAQLATKYKPAHPAMINIKAQERDLENKISDEINKIVRSTQGEVAAARAKEASLRTSLQNLQKSSAAQGQTEVQLHELERQAESNQTLYQNFLNRFKQTSTQEDIQQADAKLVAAANVPTAPSFPPLTMLIGLAFICSIVVGCLTALGMEHFDNGFRTGDQFERIANVPALGLVPDVKPADQVADMVLKHPISPYSEAIRTVRTALRYSDIDNPPKVVLVTSSLPAEGKTVFSLSLARSVASSGGRALLIDCDLRRPSLANLLKIDPKAGNIFTFFEKDADLSEVVQIDTESGMHFIPSYAGTSNPQDLLGSKHMKTLIDRLRNHYDLIVLDTPPTLAVSDSLVLSHIADTTMFLVRWGWTARPVVLGALKTFRTNGGSLAGVVLSRVDFRRHAAYGYGDSGYYYGYYGKHYAGYSKT